MHITKDFTFDAAHQLHSLPDGHKCRRLHGHTYRVRLYARVEISGEPSNMLDEHGMVVDYDELGRVWREQVHDVLDHRYLNEIPGLEVPTTEVLVRWIYERMRITRDSGRPLFMNATTPGFAGARVFRVRVYESSTTYAEYP